MFFQTKTTEANHSATHNQAILDMVNSTYAAIHFKPDGTIMTANQNFLSAMGYKLDEIAGRHHVIFVDPDEAKGVSYKEFWRSLAAGETYADQIMRITKDGTAVWLQATYAPVFGQDGKVDQVIKIATDISARRNALEKISNALGEIRNGNLAVRLPASDIPDLDTIGKAFNETSQRLSQMITTISNVSSEVSGMIEKANRSSEDLSRRTTSQAATLEQTAAALQKLTTTVTSSSETLHEAEKLATGTAATAKNSDSVVSESIEAMGQIKDSSEEMSKIISAIEDIAFQTNLLALNAGVEAARAGEAGRGFAVVASEVRALAHRSQEAAGEIKGLIQRSSDHVSKGVNLVNSTGAELKQISQSVEAITSKTSNIATGAAEQSITLGEINSGIGDLDLVTQQNASMVDEMTTTNRFLMEKIRSMSDQIEQFQTNRSSHPSVAYSADIPSQLRAG